MAKQGFSLFLTKGYGLKTCSYETFPCFQRWNMRWRVSVLNSARNCQIFRSSHSASFDVFQKLKDPPEEKDDEKTKKRKPSDKVLRIVDEILNLTLIEAADLCDLCLEKLSAGSNISAASIPGRSPFPHPQTMFMGGSFPGLPGVMPMPAGISPGQFPPAGSPFPQAVTTSQPPTSPSTAGSEPAVAENTPKTAAKDVKAQVNIKLVSFEKSKKVSVVKEIRVLTSLGLIESKELVESCPKIIKKGVALTEAEAIKSKLEALGAEVVLE